MVAAYEVLIATLRGAQPHPRGQDHPAPQHRFDPAPGGDADARDVGRRPGGARHRRVPSRRASRSSLYPDEITTRCTARPRALQADAHASRASPRAVPFALVGIAVTLNLVLLRAERLPVQPDNDLAVHRAMVDFARQRLESGHRPLGVGSPHLELGGAGVVPASPAAAGPHRLGAGFDLRYGERSCGRTLYLGLATWPISVYLGMCSLDQEPAPAAGARAAGTTGGEARRWPASKIVSDAVAGTPSRPSSSPCGCSRERSGSLGARFAVAAPTSRRWCSSAYVRALHWSATSRWSASRFRTRRVAHAPRVARRAALVALGAFGAIAWFVIPLVVDARCTTRSSAYNGAEQHDLYGVRWVLGRLVTGLSSTTAVFR